MSTVYAPVPGIVNPITESADPVFSSKMLGGGVVIHPYECMICAPCDGVVSGVFPDGHAFVIDTGKMQIMVHIGIDTVKLKGEGFTIFRKVGEKVFIGDPVVEVDFDFITSQGYSDEVVVVALERPRVSKLVKEYGDEVEANEGIFISKS